MTRRTIAIPLVALSAFVSGCADNFGITEPAATPGDEAVLLSVPNGPQGPPIRVVSRNLYLGGDIGPILGASTPQEIPGLVAQTWETIQATDFSARARVIAREIGMLRPDVIGLQEVARFRTQSPGDFFIGNPQAAEDVALDYLEILLRELDARGLRYDVATSIDNIDVELPSATSPSTFDDIRYTDRDVVLVRRGVRIDAASSGHYAANLSFRVAGAVPLTILRGWNRVDVTHHGTSYHFVNTHLETDESGPTIQELQAAELVEMLSGVDTPTFVVGDLNGLPQGGTNTYGMLVTAGFEDVWESFRPAGRRPGFTCCFNPNLQGGELFERIDFVFARGTVEQSPRVHNVKVFGNGAFGRSPWGVHPSDHARNTLNKSVPGTLDLRGGSSRAERDDRGGGRWSR